MWPSFQVISVADGGGRASGSQHHRTLPQPAHFSGSPNYREPRLDIRESAEKARLGRWSGKNGTDRKGERGRVGAKLEKWTPRAPLQAGRALCLITGPSTRRKSEATLTPSAGLTPAGVWPRGYQRQPPMSPDPRGRASPGLGAPASVGTLGPPTPRWVPDSILHLPRGPPGEPQV